MASGPWSMALAAAVKDEAQRIREDESTVLIKDGFPKGRHHYLVLPKPLQVRGPASFGRDDCALVRRLLKMGEDYAGELSAKDRSLRFHFGFHAVPSMKHLHMHVISQDLDSSSLKNKKHWNSFTTDFFMDADLIVEKLKADGRIVIDKRQYEDLLKHDLMCPKCHLTCPTLPKMKDHYKNCYR